MLIENIKLAFASLSANKLRTFLTMLGIIIGIASVIAIMTVGNSQTEENARQMSMFGVNTIEVYMWLSGEVIAQDEEEYLAKMPEFKPEMMQQMVDQFGDRIEAVAVRCYLGSGQAGIEGQDITKVYANCNIMGVNPGYFTVYSSEASLTDGQLFSSKDPANDYSCIVSDRLVNNLFGGDIKKAIGSKINISINGEASLSYTILGVYLMQGMGGGIDAASEKDISTTVYIPYANAQALTTDPYSKKISNFSLAAKSSDDVIGLTEELQAFFTSLLPEDSGTQVACYNNLSWIEDVNANMRRQTMSITMIGAIALLVGGIGVMNIMTVSITERTKEIGTRKALGAPNGAIRMQFITEAIIICLLGGVLGMLLGVAAGYIVCHFVQGIPVAMSLESVLVSFLFSFGIGVFFGFYPANKAAKMDPIEALRYE
ncbi:MAG: ABC transporter permease [Lachnospiraceae bacterium]|nr:ABC transporter permease [Lachnospiraceae bacterium]